MRVQSRSEFLDVAHDLATLPSDQAEAVARHASLIRLASLLREWSSEQNKTFSADRARSALADLRRYATEDMRELNL